jgi:hypothetical protein
VLEQKFTFACGSRVNHMWDNPNRVRWKLGYRFSVCFCKSGRWSWVLYGIVPRVRRQVGSHHKLDEWPIFRIPQNRKNGYRRVTIISTLLRQQYSEKVWYIMITLSQCTA